MNEKSKADVVVFGGGCFWCTEAIFIMLRGVLRVTPGYSGGEKDNPTYEEVSSGKSGHAEVIEIVYDSAQIKFSDLLTVFFATHDPTTPNRQGNDVGTQYRSVIFYSTPAQKKDSEDFIRDLNASSSEGKPIVTEIKPLLHFYPAKEYHKDYFKKNRENQYCELVINPKLQKVEEKFSKLLAVK